jgi:uncharacterized membrane protein YeaQ/YmgE (transglycosylase-associated protein family)
MYRIGEMPAIVALIPLALGVISCFWGYRLFRVILGIVGFIVGGFLAGSFAFGLSGGSIIITVIAAIVGAIVGALLVSVFYYVGVFVIGAMVGWMLGSIAAGMGGSASRLVLGIVLAALCGILAVVFQRILIIVATACIGSWNVIAGLYFLVTGALYSPYVFLNPGQMFHLSGVRFYFVFFLWVVLAIAGIVFQMRFGRPRRPKKSSAD